MKIWDKFEFLFHYTCFVCTSHIYKKNTTPDSKRETSLTASSTAVINLSCSHSVRAGLSVGTQLSILIGCGSVMDSTCLSALLGLWCLELWGAGFFSDAVSLKDQWPGAYWPVGGDTTLIDLWTWSKIHFSQVHGNHGNSNMPKQTQGAKGIVYYRIKDK